jgi:hypothetical protein
LLSLAAARARSLLSEFGLLTSNKAQLLEQPHSNSARDDGFAMRTIKSFEI